MDPKRFDKILRDLKVTRKQAPHPDHTSRMPDFTRSIKLPVVRCARGSDTGNCPANHLHLWSSLHRGWYSRCLRCPRRWGLHSRGYRHSGRPPSRFD